MSYQLREMTPADYDDVLSFWRRQPGVGLNESDERGPIELYLRRNPGLSQVVRDDGGRVIAAILCGHDGRRGHLHHLAVDPAHRGRGFGRRLVDECLRRLAAQGIHKCNAEVFVDNGAGKQFWLALGRKHRSDLEVVQKVMVELATPRGGADDVRP